VFSGNGKDLHSLKNFVVSGNVIRPYSSDGKARIPSTGICLVGAENSQIANNVVFDAGNNGGLIVASTPKVRSSVICRDNYNIDNTPALPRDEKGKLLAEAGIEFAGARLAHAVDGAGPARDHSFAGRPGDYAIQGDCLYIYTGDGTKHVWKRTTLADY
jgi:hypothetical protein